MTIKTQQVKIYPNRTMIKEINRLFNYRRYCWNLALDTWNTMYQQSKESDDKSMSPSEYKVRNHMVANKQDWQYTLSSRVLQQASIDLEKSWKKFFNKLANKPRFKSKKNYKPTFTTDSARIKDNKLFLDKPSKINKSKWYSIKLVEPIRYSGRLKLCTITEKADGLYASLVFDVPTEVLLPRKPGVAGVDANVKRFNYNDGVVTIYPKSLEKHYTKINYYSKQLARKRLANPRNYKTKRYEKVRIKLRQEYQKVNNIQKDIVNKFTYYLVSNYTEIHIEDLNVHSMMMSNLMSKNLHRSMFGELRRQLEYKCSWYNRKLVLDDRLYPSTQLCSECGFRKTKETYGGKQGLSGDSIHHDHQTYYCYNCGSILDRDENAVRNIINYGLG